MRILGVIGMSKGMSPCPDSYRDVEGCYESNSTLKNKKIKHHPHFESLSVTNNKNMMTSWPNEDGKASG
jgi:hypothetical protein